MVPALAAGSCRAQPGACLPLPSRVEAPDDHLSSGFRWDRGLRPGQLGSMPWKGPVLVSGGDASSGQMVPVSWEVACLFRLGHCCKLLGKDLRSQSFLFCRPSKVTGPVAVYLVSEIKMRPGESTQAALIPGAAVWCLGVQII